MTHPSTQPGPLRHVSGPYGLAHCADHFIPGAVLLVDGSACNVLGRITATDHEETWLECYVDFGDEARWIALEAPDDNVRCTVWERDTAERSGLCVPRATLHGNTLQMTAQGTAGFAAVGKFGTLVIPAHGSLDYVEFAHLGGRVAAAKFSADQPWLVGVGTGAAVAVATTV